VSRHIGTRRDLWRGWSYADFAIARHFYGKKSARKDEEGQKECENGFLGKY
jgi:hypothetical protein